MAYDESFTAFSPEMELLLEITRAQLERTRFDLTDSSGFESRALIENLWPERMAIADFLVAIRPQPSPFALAARVRRRIARRVRSATLKAASGVLRNAHGRGARRPALARA